MTKYIAILLLFCAALFAQTDTTEVASETPTELPVVTVETAESRAEVAVDSLSADTVQIGDVESLAEEAADTLSVDSTVVETMWVPRTPDPVQIAGLVNPVSGVYSWSNDPLEGMGFDELSYVSIRDANDLAIAAKSCLDIVCNLLAADSSEVDYVIVMPEDSSDYQVYNVMDKVVILEAPREDLVAVFDAYLQDLAGMEEIVVAAEPDSVAAFEGPSTSIDVEAVARADHRAKARRIWDRQFRAPARLSNNPANYARPFAATTSWNLLPDFQVGVRNSLLTPGWYNDWLTSGGVWDQAMKTEFLETIRDQQFALSIIPQFKNMFGFRIGRFGLNIDNMSFIEVGLPANLIGLPFTDIVLNESLNFSGTEIFAIPAAIKATVSYAHPIETALGNLNIGIGVSDYSAAGYLHVKSDSLSLTMTEDSVFIYASGRATGTLGGIDGHVDDPDMDNLDVMSMLSNPGFGLDLGLALDLHPLIKQELELQVAVQNIGAAYTWSDVRSESYIFEQRMPAPGDADLDSVEQYQTSETYNAISEEDFTYEVPMVLNMAAYYQPLPIILLGVGIEQALIDEASMGYVPEPQFRYQVNVYPFSWFDLSYYKENQFGEPLHRFSSGFHFGFLETGLSVLFYNGLNTNAKGVGFGLSSSLHF